MSISNNNNPRCYKQMASKHRRQENTKETLGEALESGDSRMQVPRRRNMGQADFDCGRRTIIHRDRRELNNTKDA